MDPLDDFLKDQRDDGTLESSGAFTLAWEQAREKMRQFMLPSGAHYVLKLVQVATMSGAPQVNFSLNRDSSECYFLADESELDLGIETLSDLLTRPPSHDSMQRCLAIALNGSLMDDPTQVTWGIWTSKDSRSLCIEAQAIREETDVACSRCEPIPAGKALFHFLKKHQNGKGSISASASEHALLATRCGFGATDVVVDRRSVESSLPSLNEAVWHKPFTESYQLATLVQVSDAGPLSIFIGDPTQRTMEGFWRMIEQPELDKLKGRPYLLRLEPERGIGIHERRLRAQRAISVPLNLEGPSSLIPVSHGVSLESVEILNCPWGAEVVVSADSLKTDLTGFSVIAGDQLEPHFLEARALVAQLGKDLRTVYGLPAYPKKKAIAQTARLACCCLMGWIGIFVVAYEWYLARAIKNDYPGRLAQAMHERIRSMGNEQSQESFDNYPA